MAQEEEISLEETNRIRVSLGLKPIPVPNQLKEAPATQQNNESNLDNGTRTCESISLDETNKLRVSMGLKPIPAENVSTSSVAQNEAARKNWEEKYLAEKKAKDEERIRENIEKVREKTELRKKLTGSTLGDSGSSAGDTKSWLANLKKKQTAQQEQKEQKKQHEQQITTEASQRKTQKGFKKIDNQKHKEIYDTADLKGIKVSHKLSEIQGQVGDVILTLKDSSILEDGEIELESTELVEKKKLEDKLRAKRGLRSNEEDDEFMPRKVLSKYDDIIGDEEVSNFGSFTLDGSTVLSKVPVTNDNLPQKKNAVKESLEFDVQAIAKGYGDDDITGVLGTDYQEAKPAKFKKSRKKKSKPQAIKKRKAEDDEDDIPLVDDDFDIQNALSISRRKAQQSHVKKARVLTPQELADEIKNEEDETALLPEPETDGLVISSTTDFLNVIKQRAANNKQEEKPKMQQRQRREETPEENEISHTIQDIAITEETEVEEPHPAVGPVDASVIAPEEPTLSGGLGDALKLLRTHGVLSKPNEDDLVEQQRKKQQREWANQLTRSKIERDLELAQLREEIRHSGQYSHLSQREREELAQQSNRERDLADARDAQRSFANYKPVINIEYRDEAGRLLNTKEAYKHMSHHFHGKGPGKGRVEKQLKRDEEEKKNMAKPLFGADNEGQRTSGNAGVRLQ